MTKVGGTMIERSPGVWMLQVTTGYRLNGTPIRASKTFRGTKRQAASALAGFHTDAQRGDAPMGGTTTLAGYLERWIAHIQPTRSPTTIRGYKDKARRINVKLGHVRLAKLTAQHLDLAYQEWLDEGLHPTSVHHLHGVLSAALNEAVKWGLVPRAVTELASPPPLRLRPKTIPTPDVIQSLIDAAGNRGQPILATAIVLAATTGMRRGELLGLRWPDVDFTKRQLSVARAIKHDDGPGWVVRETKAHAQRTMALDDFTIAVLRDHRDNVDMWAGEAGVTLAADAYVLTFDPSGVEPMRPDSLGQAFARVCKAAGVSGVSLHTLRHFSASVLVASGRDVRTIAGRLGHADTNTTLRVYAHMVEGRDREAADFLGELFTSRPAVVDEGRFG